MVKAGLDAIGLAQFRRDLSAVCRCEANCRSVMGPRERQPCPEPKPHGRPAGIFRSWKPSWLMWDSPQKIAVEIIIYSTKFGVIGVRIDENPSRPN
jgi:hypothetical protein